MRIAKTFVALSAGIHVFLISMFAYALLGTLLVFIPAFVLLVAAVSTPFTYYTPEIVDEIIKTKSEDKYQSNGLNTSLILLIMAIPLALGLSFFQETKNEKVFVKEKIIVKEKRVALAKPEVENAQPKYKKGNLSDWLSNKLIFPDNLIESGIRGTCYVYFIVDELGNVEDVRVLKSSGNNDLDQEAMRVISAIPKGSFIPGIVNWKYVRTKMKIPISFTLEVHDFDEEDEH